MTGCDAIIAHGIYDHKNRKKTVNKLLRTLFNGSTVYLMTSSLLHLMLMVLV